MYLGTYWQLQFDVLYINIMHVLYNLQYVFRNTRWRLPITSLHWSPCLAYYVTRSDLARFQLDNQHSILDTRNTNKLGVESTKHRRGLEHSAAYS